MKTIKLIALFTIIATASAYTQSKCEEELIKYTANLDPDSLTAEVNLIHFIKAYEDLPYYKEIRFTSSPKNPQYFLFKKTNPDAKLGYKVFDWDNIEIETETAANIGPGEFLTTLTKHQSGDYKLVIYSKSPDGSCVNVSLLKRNKAGNINIPSTSLDKNTNLKELALLKEYNEKVKRDDLPYMSEYSYVLTRNTDYYFLWERNTNLNLIVANSNREQQMLSDFSGEKGLYKYHCDNTGIYYFTIYAKEPVPQNATLKFFFDEESRKSNQK
ncbi:hypothetical protein [uncultured Marivirga sp.]|uniref:hypothetical protein n=1 Tax=uncultured Marivirga sp. TaxID=1123707 RepID=UPI0030EB3F8D|tara:strand:+ start:337001 stop:337813 length:813 start_codon:yes stop_codon:yes gene_type:complete